MPEFLELVIIETESGFIMKMTRLQSVTPCPEVGKIQSTLPDLGSRQHVGSQLRSVVSFMVSLDGTDVWKESKHPQTMARRNGLRPDGIPNLLREISESESALIYTNGHRKCNTLKEACK
ncbi:hypothetical protein TNCV_1790151 [Trichonephila clavipes]|nr:hypothetical protein TNCV_1790151 [Trichonephila clavipes]